MAGFWWTPPWCARWWFRSRSRGWSLSWSSPFPSGLRASDPPLVGYFFR